MLEFENNKVTILVVDDEPSILKIIKAQLLILGYKPLIALSAYDAIKRYTKEIASIDILLTDIDMPNIDGVKLVNKFSEISQKMKIILMSGYNLSSQKVSDMATVKYSFLKKPFTIKELEFNISKVLAI